MPSPFFRIGLALSGGGYRASAFHLGTLKKLNELGILSKVDVLSTISGGSITGAAWCLDDRDYDSFHEDMIAKLKTKDVINWIFTSFTFFKLLFFLLFFLVPSIYLLFTPYAPFSVLLPILMVILLCKFQFKIFPVSKEIVRAYNKFFYNGATLSNLKEKPLLAIGSSNLHTGRPFTFSKVKMSDSTYIFRSEFDPPIIFLQDNYPVARAVMASSCVPFAFTPITIEKGFYKTESDFYRIRPQLVDGGVYDNQGIQKITQPKSSYECSVIIVSDAGGNFIADERYPNTIALLIRCMDLFMYRIKSSQIVQNIYRNVDGAAKPIAYFSLGWRIQNCIPGFINNMIDGQVLKEVVEAHSFDPEWIKNPKDHKEDIQKHLENIVDYPAIKARDLSDYEWELARNTRTNLAHLSEKRIEYLIRHAENFTELQVKLYCPSLL